LAAPRISAAQTGQRAINGKPHFEHERASAKLLLPQALQVAKF
jgi:hypothetical protein